MECRCLSSSRRPCLPYLLSSIEEARFMDIITIHSSLLAILLDIIYFRCNINDNQGCLGLPSVLSTVRYTTNLVTIPSSLLTILLIFIKWGHNICLCNPLRHRWMSHEEGSVRSGTAMHKQCWLLSLCLSFLSQRIYSSKWTLRWWVIYFFFKMLMIFIQSSIMALNFTSCCGYNIDESYHYPVILAGRSCY